MDVPARVEPRSARIQQFEGMRAGAFLMVFLHHAFSLPLWMGNDLFFVLSGFLITGILLRERDRSGYFRKFWIRRSLRIFPAYFLFLLVAFLIWPTDWNDYGWFYVGYVQNIWEATLGPAERVPAHMGPLWSLAVEEQFYLFWPVVVFFASARRLIWVSGALVVGVPVLRLFLSPQFEDFRAIYGLLFTRIDSLAWGALLAALLVAKPTIFRRISDWGLVVAVGGVVVFGACALFVPEFSVSSNSAVFNSLGYSIVAVSAAGALAWLAHDRATPIHAVLSWPPLVYLGTISYMSYLSHEAILVLLEEAGLSSLVAAPIALVLTITWASLTWWFFEKPLVGLKDRLASYARPVPVPTIEAAPSSDVVVQRNRY